MIKKLKIVVGSATLIFIVFLILKHGNLFRNIDVNLIVLATATTAILNILNGYSIKVIANAYSPDKKMPIVWAIQIGSIATLGNVLGGLPIGTSVKFAVLNKYMGIKLTMITAGLILFTLSIGSFFALYMLFMLPFINFPLNIKVIGAVFVCLMLIVAWLVVAKLAKQTTFKDILAPIISNYKIKLIFLSALLSLSFVVTYLIIGYFVAPEVSSQKIIFIASLGNLASMLTFSQSVGGVQELSIGLAGFLTEIKFIKGIEIAFVLRIGGLISSSLILAALTPYSLMKKISEKKAY